MCSPCGMAEQLPPSSHRSARPWGPPHPFTLMVESVLNQEPGALYSGRSEGTSQDEASGGSPGPPFNSLCLRSRETLSLNTPQGRPREKLPRPPTAAMFPRPQGLRAARSLSSSPSFPRPVLHLRDTETQCGHGFDHHGCQVPS